MTKGIFNWTAEDVVRFLKNHHFVLNHTHGSHYFYVRNANDLFRQVCVPFHGTHAIKPRTLKSIIVQSGIEKEIWIKK